MIKTKSIQAFKTSKGYHIYQIPVEAFPGFWSFSYLVIYDDKCVLIDTGSGIGDSNEQLEAGIREAGLIDFGRDFALDQLTHVLITHGHVDHFGGLEYVLSRSNALVGVHELDRRNLTNVEERRVLISRKLEQYLIEAGVSQEDRENMLGIYRLTKYFFHSVKVDFTFEALGMEMYPFSFLHVPGHCAGHVVIRFDDILFCGDHILSDITPHQAPEQLTAWTGIDHYLHSLDKLEQWADGINLALCGHKNTINDLPARIAEIRKLHQERLSMVRDYLDQPNTILNLSKHLFGQPNGYNALLALEEAGAHVEYLHQRSELELENLDEVEATIDPIPLYFKRI